MQALTLLRRLAEQHNYSALREACLDADFRDSDVQILFALADVCLGDTTAGRRALAGKQSQPFRSGLQNDAQASHHCGSSPRTAETGG